MRTKLPTPFRIILPLLLGTFILVGCKKEPSLVGKWNGTTQGQNANIEFKEDKTMSVDLAMNQAKITLTGEYKLEGKNLSMTLKDSKFTGVPPQLEAIVKEGVKGALNKESKMTVEFVNEDELTFTNAGKTEKLTRIKDKV